MTSDGENIRKFHRDMKKSRTLKRIVNDGAYTYDIDDDYYNDEGSWENVLTPLRDYSYDEVPKSSIPENVLPHIATAIREAERVFIPRAHLYPVSLSDSFDDADTDEPAGYSFPNKTRAEVFKESYDIAEDLQYCVKHEEKFYHIPCKVTTSENYYDDGDEEYEQLKGKWIFPFEIHCIEKKWADAYNEFLMERVREVQFDDLSQTPPIRDRRYSSGEMSMVLTWSDIDSDVPGWLIEEAFSIMESSFLKRVVLYKGSRMRVPEYNLHKNKRLWAFVKENFIRTRIMLPDGSTYQKSHGIPSGSMFGEAVRLIVNFIVTRTLDSYFKLGGYSFSVSGDQGQFLIGSWFKGKTKKKDLQSFVTQTFGIHLEDMNLAKLPVEAESSSEDEDDDNEGQDRVYTTDAEWVCHG